ncbi:MAG TPA: hypothetical protein VJU79_00365 [Candidatus Dormibacteraeota bacterium]|nr:hypothetical protein [Candidatus Dormibacteraeota bacterium]
MAGTALAACSGGTGTGPAPKGSSAATSQAGGSASPGGTATSGASPTPAVAIEPDGSVALTEKSGGATVHVQVGTLIHVVLDNDSPPYEWSALRNTPAGILTVIDATPGNQDTVSADLKAASHGTATLSASNDPHCTPVPCGGASFSWSVTIVVQ